VYLQPTKLEYGTIVIYGSKWYSLRDFEMTEKLHFQIHRRGVGGRGHPTKYFKKFGHKGALKA
jgi:hypothetical protein